MKQAAQILKSHAAVIFDCDGTLIDSEPLHAAAMQSVLRDFGVRISASELEHRFAGKDNPTVVQLLKTEDGLQLPADFASRVESATLAQASGEVRETPFASHLLQTLSATAVPVAVASNSLFSLVELLLRRTGLWRYFAGRIATRDQVTNPKPAPDIYLHAAALLGRAPRHCLAIEDSATGVLAARAAAMEVIGYAPSGGRSGEALTAAGASMLISDLRQLI